MQNWRRVTISTCVILFSVGSQASDEEKFLLASAHGAAIPSVTTLVNYQNGYAPQNPAGIVKKEGIRTSVQYDENGSTATGFALGYSTKEWGIAAGNYTDDCDTCEGIDRVVLGYQLFDIMGIGLGYKEFDINLGLLFSGDSWTFGVSANQFDPEGDDNNILAMAYGASYSISKSWTLVVDLTSRTYENSASQDDTTILTPGVVYTNGKIQVSMNVDLVQNNDTVNDSSEDDFWAGIGFGGKKYHVAAYFDYRKDILLTLSAFF